MTIAFQRRVLRPIAKRAVRTAPPAGSRTPVRLCVGHRHQPATVADALEAEAVAEGGSAGAESLRATADELRERAFDRPHTPSLIVRSGRSTER
jgi:hypothetical protein